MPKFYRIGKIADAETEVVVEPFAYLVGVARVDIETLLESPDDAAARIDETLGRLREDLLYRWTRDGKRLVETTAE